MEGGKRLNAVDDDPTLRTQRMGIIMPACPAAGYSFGCSTLLQHCMSGPRIPAKAELATKYHEAAVTPGNLCDALKSRLSPNVGHRSFSRQRLAASNFGSSLAATRYACKGAPTLLLGAPRELHRPASRTSPSSPSSPPSSSSSFPSRQVSLGIFL